MEVTEDYIRYRVVSPQKFSKESFRTIILSTKKHIKAVVGCPKGYYDKTRGICRTGVRIQSFLFDKKYWSKSEVKKWVKTHPKGKIRLKKK